MKKMFHFNLRQKKKKSNDSVEILIVPFSSCADLFVDLRTGGRWFDTRLGQYSFQGLMIFIATGFIPFSPLSMIILTIAMWENRQWLGKNIVGSNG